MGRGNISMLERLAAQDELVAPVQYENPKRKLSVFYDFVKQFGAEVGMTIEEKRLGIISGFRHNLREYNRALYLRREQTEPERKTYLERLILGTFFYPFYGDAVGDILVHGNTATIVLPKYRGLAHTLMGNTKIHEYMHAYHAFMTGQLREEGIIRIDGFDDIECEDATPILIWRAPTYERMKRFERDILAKIIRKEERVDALLEKLRGGR